MATERAYADAVQDAPAPSFWAELLRDYPDLLGKSDVRDAGILGIHQAQLRRWKKGTSSPSVKTLTRVRHRLDLFRLAEQMLAEEEKDTKAPRGTQTSSTEKSRTSPVTGKADLPRNIEEAVAMGGKRRAVIWAMLDGLDEEALRAIYAYIDTEGWRRGLHDNNIKTRDPAS